MQVIIQTILFLLKKFGGRNFKINLFVAKTVLQKLKVRFLRYKKMFNSK